MGFTYHNKEWFENLHIIDWLWAHNRKPGKLLFWESTALTSPDLYLVRANTQYVEAFNEFFVPQVAVLTAWMFTLLIFVIGVLRHTVMPFLTKSYPKPVEKLNTAIEKFLILRPLFGNKSSDLRYLIGEKTILGRWFSLQIPLSFHGWCILAGLIINFILWWTPYHIQSPNIIYPNIGYSFQEYCALLALRTGALSVALTPLGILFAIRNSPFIMLAGLDYTTSQMYHRWITRMAVWDAIAHSVAYSAYEATNGKYTATYAYLYWQYGVAATVGGGLAIFLAWRRLRETMYEIFYIMHILCVVLYIVATYYHLLLLKEHFFLRFWNGAFGIWAGERILRWARQIWLNVPIVSLFSKNQPKTLFQGEVQLMADGGYVHLVATPQHSWSSLPTRLSGAGTYVYITCPQIGGTALQGHPFTVSWPAGLSALLSQYSELKKENVSVSSGSSVMSSAISKHPNSLNLDICIMDGFTKRLAKYARKHAGNSEKGASDPVPLKVIVEGPYGIGHSMAHYSNAVLIIGGSGISFATAHIGELVRTKLVSPKQYKTQLIHLVWAVRDAHALETLSRYCDELLQVAGQLGKGFIRIYIHYTGPQDQFDTAFIESVFEPYSSFVSLEKIDTDRPRAAEILPEFLDTTSPHSTNIVGVCGPGGLVDNTRNAVSHALGTKSLTSSNLVMVEESFTW